MEKESKSYSKWITCGHDQAKRDLLKDKQSLIKPNQEHFGEGNDTPLQYSCLENPIDGEAWKAEVHGGR